MKLNDSKKYIRRIRKVLKSKLNGGNLVHGSDEKLIQAARADKIDGLEAASVLKRSKKEKRLEDWEEKVLHSQYLRHTKEVRSDQCWAWLQKGDLKRETESLIVAA